MVCIHDCHLVNAKDSTIPENRRPPPKLTTNPQSIYEARSDNSARLIPITCPLLLRRHLRRRRRVTRWDVERRVLQKEIPRPQQQRHGLRRHDRVIFWRREVRDPKGVPQHDVGVIDALIPVLGDPFR